MGGLNGLNYGSLLLEIIHTYTRFYPKYLAGQDQTEGSYHLGAFVEAQQVLPASKQIPGTKEGGTTGNHIDGVCHNPVGP